ncbi:hypothetical protein GCM10011348_04250 [Marinobacterium nitratireducens]|uniref:Cobalt transporter n=1 Tax=Marinobacterium nitratireducens TaxID=518897 RepID=A0A917Z6L1_9GAMM|nr:hypothetical protein [Marinobacterium nitratireducens]GGO76617.1 hypothetical protein GCM10011348_04250 [Marinobacterium nitratireducens]
MKALHRTLLGLLLMLVIAVQPMVAANAAEQSDQAIWQHWQYHLEHDSHDHDDAADASGHHPDLEDQLHADACHAGHSLLLVEFDLVGGEDPPSLAIVGFLPAHEAPDLSVDTPPPIA